MLKKPSEVWKSANCDTQRDYASQVYRRVLVALDCPAGLQTGQLFGHSFNNEQNALICIQKVRESIDKNFPKDLTETIYTFLPPLFLRTNVQFILEIKDFLFLLFYSDGPIIPVVLVKKDNDIKQNNKLLNLIITIYQATSTEYVNKTNIASILNIQQ